MGELIRTLYLDGFSIEQMEEAFKRANQGFKWSGQICIWYQDERPTCIEQLQFANGNGNPKYVKNVIKGLIEKHCVKAPEPEPEPQVIAQPEPVQGATATVTVKVV